jgi:hypothetical protein
MLICAAPYAAVLHATTRPSSITEHCIPGAVVLLFRKAASSLCPCRRQVEQVRMAVNTAAPGSEAARRIAAEEDREYVLQKEQPAKEGGRWWQVIILQCFLNDGIWAPGQLLAPW